MNISIFRLGTFFAPMIPAMTIVKLILLFYLRLVCTDHDGREVNSCILPYAGMYVHILTVV